MPWALVPLLCFPACLIYRCQIWHAVVTGDKPIGWTGSGPCYHRLGATPVALPKWPPIPNWDSEGKNSSSRPPTRPSKFVGYPNSPHYTFLLTLYSATQIQEQASSTPARLSSTPLGTCGLHQRPPPPAHPPPLALDPAAARKPRRGSLRPLTAQPPSSPAGRFNGAPCAPFVPDR